MIGVGVKTRIGPSRKSSGSSWTPQRTGKFLEGWVITGTGSLTGKINGDILTVGGSAGSYTFQIPQTASYKNADTDFIWIRNDGTTWRTTTEAELVGYDFSRTLVKYANESPYAISEIWILKAGETLTDDEKDKLTIYLSLWEFFFGTFNENGFLKENRPTNAWVAEPAAPSNLVCSLSGNYIKVDFTDNSGGTATFSIERSKTNESSYSEVKTNAAGIVTWTDTTVDASSKYYYRVRAKNSLNYYSAYSNTDDETTPAGLPPNLIASWQMNGDANDSVNGYNLTNSNCSLCPDRLGNANKAYDLVPASAAFLSRNPFTQVNLQEFTVSAWFKADALTNLDVIVGNLNIATYTGGWAIMWVASGTKLRFYVGIWNNSTYYAEITFNDTTSWHHVIASYKIDNDTNHRIKISLDNAAEVVPAGVSGPTIDYTSCVFQAGRRNGPAYFDGKLDQIMFWNRELTSAEKSTVYNYYL
jgi:hypothetical protein